MQHKQSHSQAAYLHQALLRVHTPLGPPALHLACREEVIQRIEQLAISLVAAAAAGELPALTSVSTAASNVVMAPLQQAALQPAGGSQALPGLVSASFPDQHGSAQQQGAGGSAASTQHQQHEAATAAGGDRVLRLGSKVVRRSLTANNGTQAGGIVRGAWWGLLRVRADAWRCGA